MVLKRALHAVSLVLLVVIGNRGLAGDLAQQRKQFLEAEMALERGSPEQFRRLGQNLRDYPLYPYLEYRALLKRLKIADADEVTGFLDRYQDTPLAERLRDLWLNQLASRKQWSEYLAVYLPTHDVSQRCRRLQALIGTGNTAAAFQEVPEIWLYGRSRPNACDPVFAAWTHAGHRTDDMVWQRIEKTVEAGESRLAEYLGRDLPAADRVWVKRWIDLLKDPTRAGDAKTFANAHPYRETMLSYAVRRQARWDGLKGLELWHRVKPRYPFSQSQIRDTEHYIVRNLVRTPGDAVYAFIRGVDVTDGDLKVHEARIRAALLREDWPQVIRWIAVLPQQERDGEHWSYWLARALEMTGESKAAAALYATVAGERTYYGFLAADRVGSEYKLTHVATPVSPELIRQVAGMGAVQRAQELFALQRPLDAHREWRAATQRMDPEHLKAAAKLAEQRGWHDRAIFTLARTGYWDDLELRFPLEHADLVEANAKRQGIDIAWIFAVMRQESAFMSNARSHAGAMGLMQLMPATARNVARDVLKRKPPQRQDLFEPDTNIALGSAYLKQMKGELGNSAVLATAAYNAGPHRVTRWLPERTLPADIWIELVPFDETRGYLRRVLAYTVIYEKRMGLTPTRLLDRLHPVPPDLRLLGDAHTITTNSAG